MHLHLERALLPIAPSKLMSAFSLRHSMRYSNSSLRPFGRLEARENQNILAERGGELADASILGKLPGHVCEKPH